MGTTNAHGASRSRLRAARDRDDCRGAAHRVGLGPALSPRRLVLSADRHHLVVHVWPESGRVELAKMAKNPFRALGAPGGGTGLTLGGGSAGASGRPKQFRKTPPSEGGIGPIKKLPPPGGGSMGVPGPMLDKPTGGSAPRMPTVKTPSSVPSGGGVGGTLYGRSSMFGGSPKPRGLLGPPSAGRLKMPKGAPMARKRKGKLGPPTFFRGGL